MAYYRENTTYLGAASQTTAADYSGGTIETVGLSRVSFEFVWTVGTDLTADILVYGSNDDSLAAANYTQLTPTIETGTANVALSSKTVALTGAGAGRVIVTIANPPKWVWAKWDYSSKTGAAGVVNCYAFGSGS